MIIKNRPCLSISKDETAKLYDAVNTLQQIRNTLFDYNLNKIVINNCGVTDISSDELEYICTKLLAIPSDTYLIVE